MVAGEASAPMNACVGAWMVGGAMAGDMASKACAVVGLVAAETGVGLAVAAVCAVSDVTQVDVIVGAIAGTVSGLVVCGAAELMPSETAPDYRYYDAERGTSESLSDVGRRLRGDHCPAANATEADRDCWTYFRYQSADRLANIVSSQAIVASSGRVYLTWLPYSPREAEIALFIDAPSHRGRGETVIAFRKADVGVTFVPGTQWNELIHYGTLRFGSHIEPIYIGPNPF